MRRLSHPDGARIVAGIDLGFARDSAALTIAVRYPDGSRRVIYVDEARGSPATDPRDVVRGFKDAIRRYGAERAVADVHYRELMRAELAEIDVELVAAPSDRAAPFVALRRMMLDHAARLDGDVSKSTLELPAHPVLIAQLKAVRGKPESGGQMRIVHPTRDGRHGDVAESCALALWLLVDDAGDWDPRGVPARSIGFDPRYESTGSPPEWQEYASRD